MENKNKFPDEMPDKDRKGMPPMPDDMKGDEGGMPPMPDGFGEGRHGGKRKKPDLELDEEDIKFLRDNKDKGGRMGGPPGRGPGGRGMLAEKPKDTKKTLVRLLKYIGVSKWLVFGLFFTVLVVTLLDIAAPTVQGYAIDAIAGTGIFAGKGLDMKRVLFMLVILLAVYVVSSIVSYFQSLISTKLSQATVYKMRKDLFRRMSYLPISYTDRNQHGDLMSRMTNDVENISTAVSQSVMSLFSGIISIVGTLAVMFSINWVMTLVSLITIPLTIFVSAYMTKFMRKYFVTQQRKLGALNGAIEETVTGFKTVMLYNRQKSKTEEFSEISTELCKIGIKANIFGGIMGPMMNLINNLGFLLIAVVGGYMALAGAISIGFIQTFIQYSKKFSRPINELANQYSSILTAIAGAERVFEIMDAESEIDDNGDDIDSDAVKGNITFENINFAYKKGEPVLKKFNLDVKAGQKIAIVGKTGSGKTTIVNLLTRFYEINDGRILLDGRDIRDISKKSLRRSIAIVLQDTVLFSDTIKSNILYGKPDASEAELKKAAHTANADVFVERLPDGYDTALTEAGNNLSQGQRQLLSIARTVLADPRILILDEATSNVDTKTEMEIQSAMISLMKGRTSLIIAHRLSTIRDADMIIVLDDGHIVEHGNHDELIKQNGVYNRLYQTQFAGIET